MTTLAPMAALGKKSGHLPIPCVSGENPEPVTGLGARELTISDWRLTEGLRLVAWSFVCALRAYGRALGQVQAHAQGAVGCRELLRCEFAQLPSGDQFPVSSS